MAKSKQNKRAPDSTPTVKSEENVSPSAPAAKKPRVDVEPQPASSVPVCASFILFLSFFLLLVICVLFVNNFFFIYIFL